MRLPAAGVPIMARKLVVWMGGAAFAIAIVVLLVCGALWWVKENFALKDYEALRYPNGVTFIARADGPYHEVSWYAKDWKNPGRCPLVVHLPDRELDADVLSDYERLVAMGWQRFDAGSDETELYYGDRVVRCWFQDKKLFHVEVNVVAVRGRVVSPVSIGVFGKVVPLPAPESTIIEALGPPINKKSAAKGIFG